MAKLLILEKERNLLLYSNYLKEDKNFKDILEMLTENKTLGDKNKLQPEIEIKIKENLPLWLRFSIEEWESDRGNPYLLTDQEETKNCMLCNRKIDFLFKINNKFNKKQVIVGGNCVEQFKQLSSMKKMIKNKDEYRRFNKLKSKFPEVYVVLFEDEDYLKKTQLILPESYEISFKEFQNKLIKQLRAFIKDKKKVKLSELNRNLVRYNNEKQSFQTFYDKNINNEYYLLRKHVDNIEMDQKEQSIEILSRVKQNKGIVSTEVASLIKVKSYLKSKINLLESHIGEHVKLIEAKFGQYIIEINRYNTSHKFVISSDKLFLTYFYNDRKPFDLFYSENIELFEVHDFETREALQILAESILESTPKLKKRELDLNKIVSNYSDDLNAEEHSEVYQKAIRITQGMQIFSKKGETNILIYEPSKLVSIGKEVLFKNRYEVENDVINSFSQEMSLNDLYSFINKKI